jgi:hypothetical protein
MSAERDKNPSGFRAETRTTSDLHIPDWEGATGWRPVSIPPGPPKEKWGVLEAHINTAAATRWYRICRDFWATARLGAAGRVVARMLHIKAPDKSEG